MNFDSFSKIFDEVTSMKNNELWLIFDIFDRVSLVKNGLLVGTRDHDKNITLAPKERIFLQREPENTYDENAIAAYKQSGILFGHVIGSTARKLSSILCSVNTTNILCQLFLLIMDPATSHWTEKVKAFLKASRMCLTMMPASTRYKF